MSKLMWQRRFKGDLSHIILKKQYPKSKKQRD